MQNIVFQTVETYVTYNKVTMYKQCFSYHEGKFFLHQMVILSKQQGGCHYRQT